MRDDDIKAIKVSLYAIVFGVFFIAGILFARGDEATKPVTLWCVNLEEKSQIDITCQEYIWNPGVISGRCACKPGYTLVNPNTNITLPSS